MGRFLEIARNTKWLSTPLEQRLVTDSLAVDLSVFVPPQKTVVGVEPPFDALASAVLNILVEADRPVPHQAIVHQMARHGHDKIAARQAIARCQKRRWIEHNLLDGYELSYSR